MTTTEADGASREGETAHEVERIRAAADSAVALAFERDWHNFYPSWLEQEYGYDAIEEIESYPAFLRALLAYIASLEAENERLREAAETLMPWAEIALDEYLDDPGAAAPRDIESTQLRGEWWDGKEMAKGHFERVRQALDSEEDR